MRPSVVMQVVMRVSDRLEQRTPPGVRNAQIAASQPPG